ncbi:CDP-alcohol phosphatidyltransferase family protein [Mangrovitalea sediminis]|uniref:CDP-alcohol phosphatidyltransferase family protein n=1 Tax=Mangrovitalea sediminis TaxID=1982043 RepID=UPI000BE4D26E|nr:CDP-alcohol phosphatidyltransferase family protein [Mangrovitalea sediminis]
MKIGWHLIPNVLTFLRILLIIPFALALLHGHDVIALILFFIAGLSDGVDGFLARRFNWRSRFGAIADPLADKALLVTTYLVLTIIGQFPWWLFAVVVGRDIVIVSGATAYHFMLGRYEMQPSLLGKLNTLVQIVVALAVVISLAQWPMPDAVHRVGIWLVAAMAVFSGLHYVLLWGLRAWRAK